MKSIFLFLPVLAVGAVLIGCGGRGQSYDQSSIQTTTMPTGDWTIELVDEAGIVHKRTGLITDLGDLTTATGFPGFTNPIFGQFTDFGAVAVNGFTGSITLADVPGSSPSHIPCTFGLLNQGSSTPTPTLTLSPTTSGTVFAVSFAIPANYGYAATTLQFKATDAYGREKTVEIPVTLSDYSATFSPATFSTGSGSGSGSLVISPQNLYIGSAAITFDTNILSTDGVPAAFDHALPNTVTVTAPQSPVPLSQVATITTPVNFSWTSWPAGQYAVIAVITHPFDSGGQGIALRVPCEITVTNQEQ